MSRKKKPAIGHKVAALLQNHYRNVNSLSKQLQPIAPIAQFTQFAFPLIRAAFPGSGLDLTDGEININEFDFKPVIEKLNSLQDRRRSFIIAVLKEFNCDKKNSIQILVDLGAITEEEASSSVLNDIVGVQPMSKPAGLVYNLRYKIASSKKIKK